MDDPVFLSRIQFAITIGFHFLFPPISIGLAWILVIVEGIAWRGHEPAWEEAGRFFGKLLALTFAMGVATGIVMEFQFGTNWAQYSKFVGDIFGAPLAAEAIFAFFLESGFLGLYLLGRNRVSKGVHWFSILMVAVGATISAFWIIVANSWQQTPTGFVINETLGRAELTSFREAVFNPSTWPRMAHTMMASIVAGAFFMAGVCGAILRRDPQCQPARQSLKVAVLFGLIGSLLVAFPTGDVHAKQVARTQPEKFAAMEGLYQTQSAAPLVVFGIVQENPPELKAAIHVPVKGLLSWIAFGDFNATVKGIDAFPPDEIPPLWMTFVSFHSMVLLGTFLVLVMGISVIQLVRQKLWVSRKLLAVLTWSIPLPLVACQLGWITAEVGRQPWIVYKLLRTRDAASVTVTAGEVWFSIILFTLIYSLLLALYLFLLVRKTKHAFAPAMAKEGVK